jgi:hypothetical protein
LEVCTVEKIAAALEGIEALYSVRHYIIKRTKDFPPKPTTYKSIQNACLKTRFEDFSNMLNESLI